MVLLLTLHLHKVINSMRPRSPSYVTQESVNTLIQLKSPLECLLMILHEVNFHENQKLAKWIEELSFSEKTVFWDVSSCNVVEIDRRFRGDYCFF